MRQIILDTEEEMALWFSAAGNQFVHLDQPLARQIAKLTELPAWLTSPDPAGDPNPGRIPDSARG